MVDALIGGDLMRVVLTTCFITSLLASAGACSTAQQLKPNEVTVTATATAPTVAPLALSLGGSPTLGPADAKVTLVVSTDFQCPYCGRLAPTLEALHRRYPTALRVVFKNNPLGFHRRALPAAKAAMAAHLQGKFWAYHDRLFATQSLMDDADFERHAIQLGLDVDRWRADMESPAVLAKILHDQESMLGQGANGTPTSFINGKLLPGARPLEAFLPEIDQAILDADEELSRGTPRDHLHAALAMRHLSESFVTSVIEGGAPPPPRAREPRPKAPAVPDWVEIAAHPDDAFIGPVDAPVVLIEFSDFQCPYCTRLSTTLKELIATYPTQLKVVFKHQPLAFHEAARPAAMAALAAHAQGKFWAYHDLLFENQRKLSAKDLRRYAKKAGLKMNAFKAFMKDGAGDAQIVRDQALAEKVGARGTPTSYVNGFRISGAQPPEAFKVLIDQELAKRE
jgi:protein-disulfide isomerase